MNPENSSEQSEGTLSPQSEEMPKIPIGPSSEEEPNEDAKGLTPSRRAQQRLIRARDFEGNTGLEYRKINRNSERQLIGRRDMGDSMLVVSDAFAKKQKSYSDVVYSKISTKMRHMIILKDPGDM